MMSVENCTMQINDYYTWCSAHEHNGGEVDPVCKADNTSQHVVVMEIVCQGGLSPQPGIEGPGDGGSGEPGGSTSPNPCSVNGVYTNPQDPANSDCNGGVVTAPNLPNLGDDPCKKTKASTTAANNLLHESNISTEVSTLEGHAANSFTEYGMAIINTGTTTIAQDPYSNNDPSNPGKVTIIVPIVGDFLATGHTHPDHGAPPPSPADFYVTLEYARDYPTFQTSLIFVYNGTKYALVVNDRAKAIAFLAAYPFSSTTITVDDKKVFNRSSQIGKDFNDILESFSRGAFPNYSGSDQNDGLETAMAYILDKYDAGINIAKADATGNLKALRPVSFNHTIPASGGKTVIAYKAQMCP